MRGMADASVLAARAPGRTLGGMVPAPALRTPGRATDLVRADGRPQPAFRDRLRTIPSWRNALSVVSVWLQAVLVVGLAVWWGNPIGYVLAFLLMGRTQAQLAALMHEAAHRLLFANRRANDFVGRWFLGYPSFTSTDAYRRVHMAHHRQEFGPDEPDIPLYAGYPISTRELPPQAGARRDRAHGRPACTVSSSPASARRTPACGARLWKILRGAGRAARRRDRGRRLVGLPRVLGRAVPHRLARHQPPPVDRRARRHGRVARPAGHDPHRPPVVVRPRGCWSRSTSAGTSRTTSTPASRCDISPSTTARSATRATSRRRSSIPGTGRCGGRSAPERPHRALRVRKVEAWSAGFRTRGGWSSSSSRSRRARCCSRSSRATASPPGSARRRAATRDGHAAVTTAAGGDHHDVRPADVAGGHRRHREHHGAPAATERTRLQRRHPGRQSSGPARRPRSSRSRPPRASPRPTAS